MKLINSTKIVFALILASLLISNVHAADKVTNNLIGSASSAYDYLYDINYCVAGTYFFCAVGFTANYTNFGGGPDVNYNANGNYDATLIFFNLDGRINKTVVIGSNGNNEDMAKSIGYGGLISGYTKGGNTFGWSSGANHTYGSTGNADAFVAKISENSVGAIEWITVLASTSADSGESIDGWEDKAIVVGYTNSSTSFSGGVNYTYGASGNADVFITLLDKDGIKQWTTILGSIGSGIEAAYGVATSGAGDIYVTGFTLAGSYFSGTVNYTYGSTSGSDVFVTKLNSDGQKQWTAVLAGFGNDTAYDITVDNYGYIYVTGYTTSITQFAGGITGQYGSSMANGEVFVVKLDSNGNLLWNIEYTGSGTDIGFTIDYLDNDTIWVGGSTTDKDSFVDGVSTTFGSSTGGTEAFGMKINATGVLNDSFAAVSATGDTAFGVVTKSSNKNGIFIGTTADSQNFAGGKTRSRGTLSSSDMFYLNYGQGYAITPKTGYNFNLTTDSLDATTNLQDEQVSVYVYNTTINKPVGILTIDFNGSESNVSLPNLVSASDATSGKALLHNATYYPSDVTSRYLLVPKTVGNPYHCPHAESIDDVTPTCSGVNLNPSVTEITIDGDIYYKMQNQGGGNREGGGEGGTVPEFSDIGWILALALGMSGVLILRKRNF